MRGHSFVFSGRTWVGVAGLGLKRDKGRAAYFRTQLSHPLPHRPGALGIPKLTNGASSSCCLCAVSLPVQRLPLWPLDCLIFISQVLASHWIQTVQMFRSAHHPLTPSWVLRPWDQLRDIPCWGQGCGPLDEALSPKTLSTQIILDTLWEPLVPASSCSSVPARFSVLPVHPMASDNEVNFRVTGVVLLPGCMGFPIWDPGSSRLWSPGFLLSCSLLPSAGCQEPEPLPLLYHGVPSSLRVLKDPPKSSSYVPSLLSPSSNHQWVYSIYQEAYEVLGYKSRQTVPVS